MFGVARALSFFRVLFAGLPSEWDIRFISGTEKALRLKAEEKRARFIPRLAQKCFV
jgi:hypothetical protein